jgi:thiamine kinase-like enzyme
MIFKKGIATISVEKEGNFVKKVFQTQNKYKKERDFYLFTGCLFDFVPKLHKFEDETKTIWTEYCGQSLNLKYIPKDRYKFKPEIRKIVKLLANLNLYHNDIRWKNIVENDEGKLFLIDFEVISNENKERDPENILTEKYEKSTNNSRTKKSRLQSKSNTH